MSRIQVLKLLVATFALAGIALAFTPFVGSLKPNARAEANLPQLDISGVPIGSFKIFPHPAYGEMPNGYRWGVFVLKTAGGTTSVWDIPIKENNVVGMPDLHWWRPAFECHSFGPTPNHGVINQSTVISCQDENVPSWWAKQWRWDVSGQNYGTNVEHMQVTKGVVNGDFFVFGKDS